MRLAFNATALLSPLTGVGQYCLHLAGALLAQENIDIDFFYASFWSKKLGHSFPELVTSKRPWLRKIPFAYQLSHLLQNNRFSAFASNQKFDVYHEPNFLPRAFNGSTVLTAHDLSWIRYPETHPIERVRAMDRYFEPGLKQANAIITDSIFVKQELVDVFGIAPERITPIPLGVEALFVPQTSQQTQSVLMQHSLTHGQYFLAVGTLEPRKNLKLALRAFQQLPTSIRQRFPLVLIGIKGWHTAELERQMQPLVQSGEVRQLGYVTRSDLATLIAGASTLVYPSIYEGFGLPPLEAMASGVPVICSNISSLPEVVGDAGVLIDPHNDEALAQEMLRMVEDSVLRTSLADKSVLRAHEFTWQRCAEQTRAVYASVIA